MSTVISVDNLSKSYRLGQIGTGTFSNDLKVWWAKVRGKPNPLLKIGQRDDGNRDGEEVWALKDINFQVEQGEVLGIIGRNGAGKSTLLKILSRVTAPTSGQVKVKGRIASLLEVGTGFHPELTGRENVYLNGAILGMKKTEIACKFNAIVDFSGVEKFIDTPVKRYSSGMYVRLAFAVAAHLDPEILIVDEVLAVGDAEFQKKCLGKMGDVAGEGRTVLFVSHNMAAVQNLCFRTVVLNTGQISKIAKTQEAISHYLSSNSSSSENVLSERKEKGFHSAAYFTDVLYTIEGTSYTSYGVIGRPLEIVLCYETILENCNLDFAVGIYNSFGEKMVHVDSRYATKEYQVLPRSGKVSCYIPKLSLPSGRYTINLSLFVNGKLEDRVTDASVLNVEEGDFYGTGRLPSSTQHTLLIDHKWFSLP